MSILNAASIQIKQQLKCPSTECLTSTNCSEGPLKRIPAHTMAFKDHLPVQPSPLMPSSNSIVTHYAETPGARCPAVRNNANLGKVIESSNARAPSTVQDLAQLPGY